MTNEYLLTQTPIMMSNTTAIQAVEMVAPSGINAFIIENQVYLERALYILYFLIFVLGVAGNSIVIYVLMSSIFLGHSTAAGTGPTTANRPTMSTTAVLSTRRGTNLGTVGSGGSRISSTNAQQQQQQLPSQSNSNNNSFRNLAVKPETVTHSRAATSTINYLSIDEEQNRTTSTTIATSLAYRPSGVLTDSTLVLPNHNSEQPKCASGTKHVILNRLRTFFCRLLKEKLTVTNFYLLNLAVSDFLYSLFIPVLLITMSQGKWLFGSLFCKLYFSIVYLCQSSSVFILVVLSIDRYLSVKYPHKVSTFRTDEVARCVILVSWFLSLLFVTPVFLYTEIRAIDENNSTYTDESNSTLACLIHWPETWPFVASAETANRTIFAEFINSYLSPLHAFSIYTFLLNYFIPVSIIVALYARILNRLNRRTQINSDKSKVSKAKKKSLKKINKMVLAIVICYIVCWTPYWSNQVFNYFYQHAFENQQSEVLILISHLVQTIAYMSSALNPFIYSYMSEAFRTSLRLALDNCNCCLPASWSSPSAAADAAITNVDNLATTITQQELVPLTRHSHRPHRRDLFDEEISRPDSVSDYNNSSFKQKQPKPRVDSATATAAVAAEDRSRCCSADGNNDEASKMPTPSNHHSKEKSRTDSLSSSKKIRLNSSKLAFEINFHGLSNFKILAGKGKTTKKRASSENV